MSFSVSRLPSFYLSTIFERRKEFNGGPIDIFKKDIADYKDKWDILGNFVGNDELSTEKSDEK